MNTKNNLILALGILIAVLAALLSVSGCSSGGPPPDLPTVTKTVTVAPTSRPPNTLSTVSPLPTQPAPTTQSTPYPLASYPTTVTIPPGTATKPPSSAVVTLSGVTVNVLSGTDYLLGVDPSKEQSVTFNARVYNSLDRTVNNLDFLATITCDQKLTPADGYPTVIDVGSPTIIYQYSFDGNKTVQIESFKSSSGAALSIPKASSMTFRPQLKLKSITANPVTFNFTLSVRYVSGD